jgi:hypothetical protein
MKTRAGFPRVVAALALLVTIGCARREAFPDPAHTAAPDGLARADFRKVAAGGIDDRILSYPWAVSVYDGDRDGADELYVGTIANALCLQMPAAASIAKRFPSLRPPARWQCDVTHWNPDDWWPYEMDNYHPPVVFRGTPAGDGFAWERVFEPDPEGLPYGFRGSVVYQGALYMLASAWSGAVVYKTTDGVTWETASDPGVVPQHAAFNTSIRGTAIYKGRLYVASADVGTVYASDDPAPGNWSLVSDIGWTDSGGAVHDEVWDSGVSTGGNGADTLNDATKTWAAGGLVGLFTNITGGTGTSQTRRIRSNGPTQFTIEGAWDVVPDASSAYQVYRPDVPDCGPSYQLAVFNDRLYAIPQNRTTGPELWRADDPGIGRWTRVIKGGHGNPHSLGYMTVTPFSDHLYLGSSVYPGYVRDSADMTATEVLRIDRDENVELLVGRTRYEGTPDEIRPLSNYGPGFGSRLNLYSWDAAEYDGWFYLGTMDFGGLALDFAESLLPGVPREVWDALDGLLSSDLNGIGGGDLWRTRDGIEWSAVTRNGLGDVDNGGVRSLEATPWGLLVGMANPIDGFEVWMGKKDGDR